MWERSTGAGGRFGAGSGPGCRPGVPLATSSASQWVRGGLRCIWGPSVALAVPGQLPQGGARAVGLGPRAAPQGRCDETCEPCTSAWADDDIHGETARLFQGMLCQGART